MILYRGFVISGKTKSKAQVDKKGGRLHCNQIDYDK